MLDEIKKTYTIYQKKKIIMAIYSLKDLKAKIIYHPDWEQLNKKQKGFCLTILDGKNTLLAGAGGCGKSFALSFLFKFFDELGVSYGKTAMTGIAALNLQGSTVHSWLGIQLGDQDVQSILKMVFRNKKARSRIISAKFLFIDEISMCSAELFDKIFSVIRVIRRGAPLIVCICGDPMQLPPVFKNPEVENGFFFESDAWTKEKFATVNLTEIIRQRDDKAFGKILSEIRVGNLKNIHKIKERIGAKFDLPEGIQPVKVFGYNSSVDNYNNKILKSLPGKSHFYKAKDDGDEKYTENFNRNSQAPQLLELKEGAQVMLTYNVNVAEGLVNGLIGKVIGFETQNNPIIKFTDGQQLVVESQTWEIKEQIVGLDDVIKYKTVATRTQVPLKLSWANSTHKCQSLTLDYISVDLHEAFEYGMAYTALSRVKSLNGLSIIRDFDEDRISVNPKCLKFYNSIK